MILSAAPERSPSIMVKYGFTFPETMQIMRHGCSLAELAKGMFRTGSSKRPASASFKTCAEKLVCWPCYLLGITRLFAWRNRNRTAILCYHSITEASPDSYCVTRQRFEDQLRHLRKHCSVVTLEDYVRSLRSSAELPPYAAVVTFDDGHRDFLTAAVPVLQKENTPGTMFLITDNIVLVNPGCESEWRSEDTGRMLSWEEIQRLAKLRGIAFGSHTQTHPDLTQLPFEQAYREIAESRSVLEQHLGSIFLPFAYPYGKHSRQIADLAESVGYSCALAGGNSINTDGADPFRLRRVIVSGYDDIAVFAARVSGLHGAIRRLLRYDSPGTYESGRSPRKTVAA